MRDVWRAAHYLGNPVTVPPLPRPPVPPLLRITAAAAGFEDRQEFVRGEAIGVEAEANPGLRATAVRLDLLQTGRILRSQQHPLAAGTTRFTIDTAPYAYGPYTLMATALAGDKPAATASASIGIRYIPPQAFNWEMSVAPGPSPLRTDMEYANIAAAGLELYAGGQTTVGMDAAIRHGMGFSLRIDPELTGRKAVSFPKNPQYDRLDGQGKPIGNPYTAGRPGLGISHPDIRAHLRKAMEEQFHKFAHHPAARPYCLLNDDWTIYYGWDYSPHVLADFRSRTGLEAPRKMKRPEKFGAIADNDPWIEWFR
jgi:hypothetical protein